MEILAPPPKRGAPIKTRKRSEEEPGRGKKKGRRGQQEAASEPCLQELYKNFTRALQYPYKSPPWRVFKAL